MALVVVIVGVGALGYVWGKSSATSASGSSASAAAAVSKLSRAYRACQSQDSARTLQLGDGGRTIIVDTRDEYVSMAGVECLWAELETPQSITAKVGSTTAMMGEQSAQSGGLSYSWSYHPDNGLNMVITLNG
jgi:hypothetical protein